MRQLSVSDLDPLLESILDYQYCGGMAGAKRKAITSQEQSCMVYTLPRQASRLGVKLWRETGVLGHPQRKIAAWHLGD